MSLEMKKTWEYFHLSTRNFEINVKEKQTVFDTVTGSTVIVFSNWFQPILLLPHPSQVIVSSHCTFIPAHTL